MCFRIDDDFLDLDSPGRDAVAYLIYRTRRKRLPVPFGSIDQAPASLWHKIQKPYAKPAPISGQMQVQLLRATPLRKHLSSAANSAFEATLWLVQVSPPDYPANRPVHDTWA